MSIEDRLEAVEKRLDDLPGELQKIFDQLWWRAVQQQEEQNAALMRLADQIPLPEPFKEQFRRYVEDS